MHSHLPTEVFKKLILVLVKLMYIFSDTQGVSQLVDINARGDYKGLCDQ